MKHDDKLKGIKESLLGVMREPRRWLLLVGTGASVEMDPELGMGALATHLLTNIPNDTTGWATIAERLEQHDDLETALTGINPTETLQKIIAQYTSEFVAKTDAELRDGVLTGTRPWVGGSLLQQLIRGLSPTWPRLPVVTPNYDMLIEYACSKANIPYITGYSGGIMRRQDWAKARERLYRLNQVILGGKRRDTITAMACVELMKVHGSINLFRCSSDDSFVENDVWIAAPPPDYTPMIAPPGDTKTQKALNYYNRLFGEAEQAISKATAFFVIGYGFRDEHIHQKILQRVFRDKCPLVVLTRDPSKALSELPGKGDDVWVVTAKQDAAGNVVPSGTCVANRNPDTSGDFDGVDLWQSNVFTQQILGG